MSLIGSLMALVLIPLKAKPNEAPTQREVELADEVNRANFALAYWRNAGMTLMEENDRLIEQNRSLSAERDRLRAANESLFASNERLIQAHYQQQSFQGLGQLADQVMQNAAFAQYAQAMPFRNCVPSRGDVLGR